MSKKNKNIPTITLLFNKLGNGITSSVAIISDVDIRLKTSERVEDVFVGKDEAVVFDLWWHLASLQLTQTERKRRKRTA